MVAQPIWSLSSAPSLDLEAAGVAAKMFKQLPGWLITCVPPPDSGGVVEAELVLLLNQLCVALVKDPSVLELFFHTSEDQGAANFLLFSLLIPYTHRYTHNKVHAVHTCATHTHTHRGRYTQAGI